MGAANVFGTLVVGLVIDYVIANAIDKLEPSSKRAVRARKWLLAASVVINVGALGYYKDSNFFVAQLGALLAASGTPAATLRALLNPASHDTGDVVGAAVFVRVFD